MAGGLARSRLRVRSQPRSGVGAAVAVALLLSALLLSACQVTTHAAVTARADGSGAVTVTVTFDREAAAAVGDLKSQLQTADLVQAGWRVTGPSPGPEGSTVVVASHPFARLDQVSGILAQVAGSSLSSASAPVSSASAPVFSLRLARTHTFWRTQTKVDGDVDLTCGIGCFVDPALSQQLGTALDPSQVPSNDFTFQLSVDLPGTVVAPSATTRSAGSATWTVPLGGRTSILATARTRNALPVALIGVAAGLLLLVVAGVSVRLWWRRRRATGPSRPRGGHFAGGPVPEAAAPATASTAAAAPAAASTAASAAAASTAAAAVVPPGP